MFSLTHSDLIKIANENLKLETVNIKISIFNTYIYKKS